MESSHAVSSDESRPPPDGHGLDGRHAPGLADGIGERVLILDDRGAPSLELLRFRQRLTTIPGFEVALRRTVERLRQFRHPAFARTPAVEYLGRDQCLALLSTYTPGRRLSEVLAHTKDPAFAASLLHQLVPALDALHEYADGIGHGALTASRIIITPSAQLTIVEHVLGPALERLHLTGSGMRRDLGIPVPAAEATRPLTDGSIDCFQLAAIALSMLLGRPLQANDYSTLDNVLETVLPSITSDPESTAATKGLRTWLERALQLDARAFQSSGEAKQALGDVTVPPAGIADHWRELLDVPGDVESASIFFSEAVGEPLFEQIPNPPPPIDSAPRIELPKAEPPKPALQPIDIPAILELPALLVQHDPEPVKPPPAARLKSFFFMRNGSPRWGVVGLMSAVLMEAFVIGVLVAAQWGAPPPPAPVARVTLMTADPGASVTVDGQAAGVTPLQLTIGPEMRSISVDGARPAPKQESIVGSTGQQHEAAGSARGAAVADPRLRPAPPAAPPPPRAGAIRVSSPIELEVFDGETRLGSTSAGILSAAAGRHEFDLVNNALGFRSRQVVDIKPGQTVALTMTPPNGRININAVPWAEVLIDGKSVGETPIGNLSISLGEHEITFRHPQLGEVRRTAIVRADTITRVSANLQR